MKTKIRILILMVLIVVLAVSVGFLSHELIQSREEDEANQELVDEVNRLRESLLAEAATATTPQATQTTAATGSSTASSTSTAGTAPATTATTAATTVDTSRWQRFLEWLAAQTTTATTTAATEATQDTAAASTGTQAPQTTASTVPLDPNMLPQYATMYQRNTDLAGWLTIPGTKIDYPVMYTPYNIEKYLRLGFNGKYASSGSLFLGEGWSAGGNYAIIYGHHMKNGTMFSALPNYASQSYASQHPTFHFDTLYEEREYEVVAAFYSKVYGDDEPDAFRYYAYTSLPSQEIFDEYISQIRAIALYDTGVSVQYGDSLLVLSTCSYHTDDGRFAVLARRR